MDECQAGFYQLDPFHLACQFGQTDGLYSMRRLAPERFHTTEYFRSYYRYLELAEKLGLIITVGKGSRAVLSLLRRRGASPSTEEERQLLRNAAPVAEQVVRLAWEAHRRGERCVVDDLDDWMDEAFEQFGRNVLTRREREVARLLLEGHSSISASQCLQISPGTVKVHRRSLYEKLSIGSQSQLLALFVRRLKRRDEA
ncbi:helix-turn-helix transcriptional regulator [Pseudomonas sp. BN415]|uniref:helix-turn-helix transcriptional regulator n=1 Tax=Pseudomonas sp. BN415 TaxID=2567889 RepID=UPI002453CB8A|nr:helix-turn-helix transcriptional regulator [Pseudomonas sp. BN415]